LISTKNKIGGVKMVFGFRKKKVPENLEEAINQGSQILAEPFKKALTVTAEGAYKVGRIEMETIKNQEIARINETHAKEIAGLNNKFSSYEKSVKETLEKIQAQKQELTRAYETFNQAYTQVMKNLDVLMGVSESKGKK
jgi:hypothetical protein